ncbi:MAG: hypothetical protein MZV70_47295 [Desulfobacterales bacterium]|nr:hypothetical protein [Desulfobacterales bacterium]
MLEYLRNKGQNFINIAQTRGQKDTRSFSPSTSSGGTLCKAGQRSAADQFDEPSGAPHGLSHDFLHQIIGIERQLRFIPGSVLIGNKRGPQVTGRDHGHGCIQVALIV